MALFLAGHDNWGLEIRAHLCGPQNGPDNGSEVRSFELLPPLHLPINEDKGGRRRDVGQGLEHCP